MGAVRDAVAKAIYEAHANDLELIEGIEKVLLAAADVLDEKIELLEKKT